MSRSRRLRAATHQILGDDHRAGLGRRVSAVLRSTLLGHRVPAIDDECRPADEREDPTDEDHEHLSAGAFPGPVRRVDVHEAPQQLVRGDGGGFEQTRSTGNLDVDVTGIFPISWPMIGVIGWNSPVTSTTATQPIRTTVAC